MKKRIFVLLLVVALAATALIGSTLSYLTAKTESITNTFELGDITYSLTLHANAPGGHADSDVAMPVVSPNASQEVAAGSAEFTLNKAPSIHGYTFLGWCVDKEGKQELYAPGTTKITVGYNDDATVTNGNSVSLDLYAKWEVGIFYTVTYDANLGSFENNSKVFTETKAHDATYTLNQIKPERAYFVWTQWNTKPDGSGTTYLGGDAYSANENLTLYAIWAPETEVTFGKSQFVNMGEPQQIPGSNEYNFTIQCKTQGGADGIVIPIYNLIPGQAYKLTFTVEFNNFQFYTEDSQCYIFGTNIVNNIENYHTKLSILSQPEKTVTSKYENMQWSTEEGGRHNTFLEFVADAETMYWFWETTDIVDGQLMSYQFNNFNIQMLNTYQPEVKTPRIEFEDLTVKFATAPFINKANDPSKLTAVTAPIDTSTNSYGTRWVDYKNGEYKELTARHKNYFHTEFYDFDELRYRMWGYEGHEVMTIPITGLEKDKNYTITFSQDLSGAYVYNTNPSSLNGNQMYGCAVTSHANMDADYITTNSVNKQAGYQDLRRAKVGAQKDGLSITFTATADTMYWQWLLGDLIDGSNPACHNRYSVVKLSNVKIFETTAPASVATLAMESTTEQPENIVTGEEIILTAMPDMVELEASVVVENMDLYAWQLEGGTSVQIIEPSDLEETLTAIFADAADYEEEVSLTLTPLYVQKTEEVDAE